MTRYPAWSIEGMKQRLLKMERDIADLNRRGEWRHDEREVVAPVPFHWPGAVADHIDVRVEPGWFPRSGKISRIVWRFGTADSVTVDWELDGVNFDTQTFSADTVELPGQAYAGENIAAIVTAAGGSASGLTAWVYLD